MLAIPAHCHEGRIQLPAVGLPRDAKVVVLFLDSEPPGASITQLSSEQQAALLLQSQSNFSQSVLLHPAEDCWNNV